MALTNNNNALTGGRHKKVDMSAIDRHEAELRAKAAKRPITAKDVPLSALPKPTKLESAVGRTVGRVVGAVKGAKEYLIGAPYAKAQSEFLAARKRRKAVK